MRRALARLLAWIIPARGSHAQDPGPDPDDTLVFPAIRAEDYDIPPHWLTRSTAAAAAAARRRP